MTKVMYLWLSYSEKNSDLKRIQVAVKNIRHLFCMASELLKSKELHPFIRSNGYTFKCLQSCS